MYLEEMYVGLNILDTQLFPLALVELSASPCRLMHNYLDVRETK